MANRVEFTEAMIGMSMKRASYKPGYGGRQRQREFIAKLLQTGFAVPIVAEYTERKYDMDAAIALKVVRYVQGSLSRVERKP